MIHKHIAEAIKNPTIIKLKTNLYVARFENMKLYSTLYAIKSLLQKGTISHYHIVIDSSSGIYAQALALACHQYKIKYPIIASSTVDKNFANQLTLMGATVEIVDTKNNLQLDQQARINRIQAIMNTRSDHYYWMQQYHDKIHYKGYQEFASLLHKSLSIRNLCIIGGVGSGCSTGGLIQHLTNIEDSVKLIGIQPFGSISFGSEHIQDPKTFAFGIGSAISFNNISYRVYDKIHWISLKYALSGSVALLKTMESSLD